MQFIEISQCRTINFQPVKRWPENLPPICIGHDLIAGFDSTSSTAVQVQGSFEDILIDCYPRLSLPELARLFELRPDSNWDAICSAYNFRFSNDLKSLFDILAKTPMEFQNWASEKDLGIKDLAVLRISMEENFLREITKCSKQQGCKILEWGTDLSGDVPWTRILQNSHSADKWYEDLYQLRFPVTAGKDLAYSDRVIRTPWPRQVDANWKRSGDKAGIEIRFTTTSPKDFRDKSEALIKLQAKIEKIWNPN